MDTHFVVGESKVPSRSRTGMIGAKPPVSYRESDSEGFKWL